MHSYLILQFGRNPGLLVHRNTAPHIFPEEWLIWVLLGNRGAGLQAVRSSWLLLGSRLFTETRTQHSCYIRTCLGHAGTVPCKKYKLAFSRICGLLLSYSGVPHGFSSAQIYEALDLLWLLYDTLGEEGNLDHIKRLAIFLFKRLEITNKKQKI